MEQYLEHYEEDTEEAFVRNQGGDEEMEVLADIDGNEGAEDFDDDDEGEEDEAMEGCESGEPARVAEREDAQNVLGREVHTKPIFTVAAAAAGGASLIATGSGDDTAVLWRSNGEKWDHSKLEGHSDTVSSVAFSSDGCRLATGGLDGKVCVWGTEGGKLARTLEGPGGAIEWVSWHPRGPILLSGSEDYTSWMWNVETGACMQVFAGHRGEVTCGTFTPDGKTVVTAGVDASLRIWSPRQGTATAVVEGYPFHKKAVTSLDISGDSTTVITGGEDGLVCLTNVSGKILSSLTFHTDVVECVGLSSSSHTLGASASLDCKVAVWDLATQQVKTQYDHVDGIVSVVWHPSAPLLASAGLDGIARLWDARTTECVREFHGHTKSIHKATFDADGSSLITCSEDCTSRIFKLDG